MHACSNSLVLLSSGCCMVITSYRIINSASVLVECLMIVKSEHRGWLLLLLYLILSIRLRRVKTNLLLLLLFCWISLISSFITIVLLALFVFLVEKCEIIWIFTFAFIWICFLTIPFLLTKNTVFFIIIILKSCIN